MDEITIALYYNLINIKDVLEIIKNKSSGVELILTGRYAPQELIEVADLVTEMKEVKHYYTEGIEATGQGKTESAPRSILPFELLISCIHLIP